MLRWREIVSAIDFANADAQTGSLACSKPTHQLELQIPPPCPSGGRESDSSPEQEST